jgi:tetratricopeptide (TPR) repeat protein
MKRAGRSGWMGAASSSRWAMWGLITTVAIGCASAGAPGGSVAPRPAEKGPSGIRTAPLPKGTSPTAYREGIIDIQQGRLESAQQIFEKLIVADPNRVELHNALGIVYRRRALYEKAVSEYTMAIALAEKSPAEPPGKSTSFELYNNLGIAYREGGDFKKAEEAYRKAIALNPNYAAAYYNLGVLYDLYLNQPSDALRNYREYEKLAGQNQNVDVWIQDLEQRTGAGRATGVGQP